jgi:hypothetical protein
MILPPHDLRRFLERTADTHGLGSHDDAIEKMRLGTTATNHAEDG